METIRLPGTKALTMGSVQWSIADHSLAVLISIIVVTEISEWVCVNINCHSSRFWMPHKRPAVGRKLSRQKMCLLCGVSVQRLDRLRFAALCRHITQCCIRVELTMPASIVNTSQISHASAQFQAAVLSAKLLLPLLSREYHELKWKLVICCCRVSTVGTAKIDSQWQTRDFCEDDGNAFVWTSALFCC